MTPSLLELAYWMNRIRSRNQIHYKEADPGVATTNTTTVRRKYHGENLADLPLGRTTGKFPLGFTPQFDKEIEMTERQDRQNRNGFLLIIPGALLLGLGSGLALGQPGFGTLIGLGAGLLLWGLIISLGPAR